MIDWEPFLTILIIGLAFSCVMVMLFLVTKSIIYLSDNIMTDKKENSEPKLKKDRVSVLAKSIAKDDNGMYKNVPPIFNSNNMKLTIDKESENLVRFDDLKPGDIAEVVEPPVRRGCIVIRLAKVSSDMEMSINPVLAILSGGGDTILNVPPMWKYRILNNGEKLVIKSNNQ